MPHCSHNAAFPIYATLPLYMDAQKPKLIIVVGPTASGKSGLAVTIAKKYGGEIISADSRQVYRKLDIGTAKITTEEMQNIPHHFIDICDIDTPYSAFDFKKEAAVTIQNIEKRGNLPIIAGGTFFYVDTLLGKISAPEVPPNQKLRNKLEAMTPESLYDALLKLDPRRAEDIDAKNKRRLIRALEIIEACGNVPEIQVTESPYNVLMLGIKTDKETLRSNFRSRATQWLAGGFLEEIKSLIDTGIIRQRLTEMGFEYQLGMDLLDGKITEAKFLQSFEEKNWQYAKRQLTWLKRDPTINWVSLSDKREVDLLIKQFLMN